VSEPDYSIEDQIMRDCKHERTFILSMRHCEQCGAVIESEVIEPGTETLTHHVRYEFKP
jgi:hypothetical protein